MKTRTVYIGALGAVLGLAIVLTLQRTQRQRTPMPRDAATEVPDAHGLATDQLATDQEASAPSLEDAVRDAALANAREEQQQQWQELRRNQVFAAPMAEALRDAQVLQDAIKQPPPRVTENDQRLPPPQRPLGNLAEMSETFRNTTFLVAIRDAGFVCDAVVAAHQTDADIWMARCREVGTSYKIDVSDTDELFVRPVAGYIDALAPVVDDRFRIDRDAPLRPPLPPQQPRNE